MGFARLFSTHVSAPVITRSFKSKSPDADNGFGSDFQRLGQVAPSSTKSAGRAWRICPERTRTEFHGTSLISFGAWLVDSGKDIQAAQELTASSTVVRDQLKVWRASFVDSTNADRAYEGRRHNARMLIERGDAPSEEVGVRGYDVQAHRVQAGAIDALSRLSAAQTPVSQEVPGTALADRGREAREGLAELCTAMYQLTAKSLRNRITQIRYDQRDLFQLNDMTREAQKERSFGGADVPLRLAVRGDKFILKPAKSRSRLAMPKQRARCEAANLAMLVGLAPGEKVTLGTLHARGFGTQETTFVLNDALSKGIDHDRASWLLNRTCEMQAAKGRAEDILAKMTDTQAEAYRVSAMPQALFDNDLDETSSTSSEMLLTELTSVTRTGSPQSEASDRSYVRASSVDDDVISAASTPEAVRVLDTVLRESEQAHASERANSRPHRVGVPPLSLTPGRFERQPCVSRLTIEEEAEGEMSDEGEPPVGRWAHQASPWREVSEETPRAGRIARVESGALLQRSDPPTDARNDRVSAEVERIFAWSRAGRAGRMMSPPPSVELPVVLSSRQVPQGRPNVLGATGAAGEEQTRRTEVKRTGAPFSETPPPLPSSAPPTDA